MLLNFAGRHRRVLQSVLAVVVLYTIAGFLLVPWLIEKIATETARERYGATLGLEEVAFNPYVLSLKIDGLELDEPGGEPVLEIRGIFVNFQLSSLFRLAWTFDEFRIDAPQIYLHRDGVGAMNVAFLAGEQTGEPEATPEEATSLPRLFVFDFAVNEAVVDWRDEVPRESVATRFGPVDVSVVELNTLPQRPGEQAVVITTETQGTLTWSGSLQLNPFRSSGHAEVDGSHFPLISAYLRDDIGFEIVRGDADLELDYMVEVPADGPLQAAVDDLRVMVTDLLVQTYDADATPDSDVDPEVLALPGLELSAGRFRWPERSVSIESIDMNDAALSVYRDSDGALNLIRTSAAGDGAADGAAPAASATSAEKPWTLSLERFSVNRASVDFLDDSVSPRAALGAEDLNLTVGNISNADGAVFPTTLSLATRSGGSVTADGEVTVLPDPIAEFTIGVADASLTLLHPYIQPLADVRLDSGTLNATVSLRHDSGNPLTVEGDADIVDFLITETKEGSRLGSWSRFVLDDIAFDLGADTLDIGGIRFDEPYADILIDENGGVNLGRIGKGQAAPEDAAQAGDEEPRSALAISIGGVEVTAGSARFADLSLPLPFEAEISTLEGRISTIATTSDEPAEIDLEGTVDEYGLVRVSGTVTPLDPPKNTDVAVLFQNVEMPKMSAYTIPFASREIASGRLDLDLGYRLEDGQMQGRNNIVLRDFELGAKVPHPGAMSLPLGLAVALLKDSSGTIDIDLPVSGDVNDPEFSYGGVVLKALANLIIRIAASPFALLGNLLGVEASELEYIRFEYGRADLTPPEQERIAKLAEALSLRPELRLEVPPVVNPERDGTALRAVELDTVIDARLGAADDDDDSVANRRVRVLETLFRESAGDDAETNLEALRQEFTLPAGEPADDTTGFDALAYAAELRRRLIPEQPLDDQALTDLATRRAEAVRIGIIAIDPALEARAALTEIEEVSTDGDSGVRAKVSLGVDE